MTYQNQKKKTKLESSNLSTTEESADNSGSGGEIRSLTSTDLKIIQCDDVSSLLHFGHKHDMTIIVKLCIELRAAKKFDNDCDIIFMFKM